jgi:O-antigen ligase
MAGHLITGQFDGTRLARNADWIAVAMVASLPWSTSATGILVALWLLALIPALEWTSFRHALATAAGGLPVLLVLFGVLGMLWADVTWIERWHGLDSFLKLLAIPLLLAQFSRSDRAVWVIGGYLLSCVVLLVASTLVQFVPGFSFVPMKWDHVLVKNGATQSGEFATCIFGLIFLAYESIAQRQWSRLLGLLAVILAMLANILFVATGRTALVVMLVLVFVFAARKLRRRDAVLFFACAAVVLVAGWITSPYFRTRTGQLWTELQKYEATGATTSSGERIEFAKKSIAFIREAPVIGHGTGAIHALFARASEGRTGAAGSDTTNPHNQTFAVAIQLGLVGAVVLWAMWLAHLLLFRGDSLVQWVGLVVVIQNIVGSLFNSHLFDFMQGWVYVFGVGIAGGVALKNRMTERPAGTST